MSDEITIKKDDLWKYSTFVLIGIVLIGAIFFFVGNPSGDVTQNDAQPDTESPVVRASLDDDAVLGNKDAPVTIVEFSDYQCPFCRKFWTETYPQIKSEYIDTGKVKLVYRDFPLSSIHPMAQPSAEAAECVHEKGGDEAYFKMHDKIFSEQNILDSGSAQGPVTTTVSYTGDDIKSWAKEIGYNIDSCLDSGKYRNEVQKDLADATTSGFQGTPGFAIVKGGDSEGLALRGAYPFDAFQQAIEAALQ
ncbi:DsbA family protein [Candidatus Pacearchaeota archaeon]|nr:DsbA family protein [Candidatus Pacearchaeota archaeon]